MHFVPAPAGGAPESDVPVLCNQLAEQKAAMDAAKAEMQAAADAAAQAAAVIATTTRADIATCPVVGPTDE